MDRRCGPLPSFIYGTYYQYNSHGSTFPTPAEAKAARLVHEAEGEGPPLAGPRATSTISYASRHGVHAYNARQRRVLGDGEGGGGGVGGGLRVHERLRAAVSNATGGMEVAYHPNWGLPGAQITFSHRVMEHNVFQAHIDGSWAPITEEFRGAGGCVPLHRLSVTLTLQTPATGGGLDLWVFDRTRPGCNDGAVRAAAQAVRRRDHRKWQAQLRQQEQGQHGQQGSHAAGSSSSRSRSSAQRSGPGEAEAQKAAEMAAAKEAAEEAADVAALGGVLRCVEKRREAYVAGEVVVHSGSVIHAVAPWGYAGPAYDQARVTIQGFAFLCGGKWHLHW